MSTTAVAHNSKTEPQRRERRHALITAEIACKLPAIHGTPMEQIMSLQAKAPLKLFWGGAARFYVTAFEDGMLFGYITGVAEEGWTTISFDSLARMVQTTNFLGRQLQAPAVERDCWYSTKTIEDILDNPNAA